MAQRIAHVPIDVLDRVFANLEAITEEPGSFGFRPMSCLHPLLFVCKEWHSMAERRLYTRVGFDSRKTFKKPSNNASESLYTTVKSNRYLASLVRGISMAVAFESREDSFRHAQILRLCQNIKHVSIGGSHNRYLDDINTALAQRDVVDLTFVRLNPPGDGPSHRKMVFRTTSEIIRYLFDFPHLQRFSSNTSATLDNRDCEFDDDGILPSPSLAKGCCLALHTIEIRGSVLKPKHLHILSEIAPNVTSAALSLRGTSANALQACLRSWSSTLTHISLLILEPDVGSSAERVADVLQDDDALHSFRHLEIWLGSQFVRDATELSRIQIAGRAIGEVCNKRQIRLDCKEKNSRGHYVLRTYNY